ncbi:MAG: H4MPT-linked C1 transfer pathway protein [Pirellulales bacterium]|nr:H4MPT-linked C1 transfer pathway protein [Pirellulales bacterium]
MAWLGLDIGGANLKAADGRGYAAARPFALWKHPERLTGELQALLADAPEAKRLAVTMTGELADCFESKAQGVYHILEAVERLAGDRSVAVYLVDGRLATPAAARAQPLSAAASNWHALAKFANRFARQWPAMVLDLGSTTADIIPLDEGGPCATGATDTERLACGELVYTGIERTPIAALVGELRVRGRSWPTAAELFATTADAYLLLGELPEDPSNVDTADGRPRTAAAAQGRLARMVCADADWFSRTEAVEAAAGIREAQLSLLGQRLRKVAARVGGAPRTVILSGQGEFLLRRLAERTFPAAGVLSLKEELGELVSRCACAHAVAALAREGTSEASRR